jgi:hypothetical protein
MTRLIDWNVDVLLRLLKLIAAARSGPRSKPRAEPVTQTSSKTGETVIDEVIDIIALPKFDAKQPRKRTLNQSN